MVELLQSYGLWGLFIGSFLAATVVPFSSDILFWGTLLGGLNPVSCLIVASLGNWLGGLTSYGVGWLGKWEWIERWFHVKPETLQRQQGKIDRWGPMVALLCWVPLVGDVFAIGLGFYKIAPVRCAFWMLVGKVFRYALWMALFYLVGIEPVL